MKTKLLIPLLLALLPALVLAGAAAAAPTAPSPVSPANGAQVVEPFTISWTAATDPTGIQDYHWEVSTTSTFSTFAMRGAPGAVTQDQVSGLPNGTYFWRVQAVNNSFVLGPWSVVSSFTVTDQGAGTPGTPVLTAPANGAQYHPYEAVTFSWTPVAGASHYLFQDAQDPNFQVAPFTIDTSNTTVTSITFAIADPNTYYARVRAVSPDGVLGLPSSTLRFVISFNAPLPPPPSLLSPANGAGPFSLPITLDWSDVPNAQANGYEVQIDPNSNFPGGTGGVELTIFIGPTSQVQVNSLTGGTKFWRVRSYHGNASPTTSAVTAWSAVRSFIVNPGPPSLVSLTFNPTSVSGGDFVAAIVQLNTAAPAGGTVVNLMSSNPSVVPAPASFTVPAGSAVGSVTFQTGQTTTNAVVPVTASLGSQSVSGSLTVMSPSLQRLDIGIPFDPQPSGVQTRTGTVVLNGRAPAGGAVVTLTSSDPAASIPASLTIAAGAQSNNFAITTNPVPTTRTVTITATWKGQSLQAQFTLVAPVPPSSLVIDPSSVTGGSQTNAVVSLQSPAPPGGQVVQLASGNPTVASLTASVTVLAGSSTTSVPIVSHPVAAATSVMISATSAGVTVTAPLTVNPSGAPPPTPTVSSLTLNPTSVTGGGTSQGTVTLSAAAPSGGATVQLTSSNTAAATVPASVTVPPAANSAAFTVTTKAVTTSTTVTISGSAGGVSRAATLTVSPAGGGGGATLAAPSLVSPAADARFSPGQSITFDWSDVAGAASYAIQVDDSDTFSAPLIASQTVTVSQYATSTLPATTMWWRVRAVDAAGNAGPWSAIRRFEVK
jgi:hypothetical protein